MNSFFIHYIIFTLVHQIKLSSNSDLFSSPVRLHDKVISSPVKNKNRDKDRGINQRNSRQIYGPSPQHSRSLPIRSITSSFLFNMMLSLFMSYFPLQTTMRLPRCSIFLNFLSLNLLISSLYAFLFFSSYPAN